MDDFKEMVLLFEELIRKETIYIMATKGIRDLYGSTLEEEFGVPKAKETMKIIFGYQAMNGFFSEYYRRKEELKELF